MARKFNEAWREICRKTGVERPCPHALRNMLPEQDRALAFELAEKLVLAWGPDFTKTTPAERMPLDRAESERAAGDYVRDNAINWN